MGAVRRPTLEALRRAPVTRLAVGRRWRRAGSAGGSCCWRVDAAGERVAGRRGSSRGRGRWSSISRQGRARPGSSPRRRCSPGGRLITSDREPGMVEAAERVAAGLGVTNAEFRVLDAERARPCRRERRRRAQPVRLHPPRRPAAGARARSAACCGRGGRLAFSVWAGARAEPVDDGARRGDGRARPPRAAVGGRGAAVRAAQPRVDPSRSLAAAGFAEAEIEELPVAYRFADADELWFFVSELRGPVALALAELRRRGARRGARRDRGPRHAHADGGFELGGVSLNVAVSSR